MADGLSPQIYLLFLLGLPFEIKTIPLMFVAFFAGIFIDVLGATYGMHTSALLVLAILRPIVFQIFAPREGYDYIKEPSIADYGLKWYLSTSGILTFVFHLYFFTLELFSWAYWKEIFIYSTLNSLIAIFLMIIIQYSFLRKPNMS
ncbi:MAG: hypothetical protein JJT77_13105 [Crocinitomicaceae bacterium]|nr:hypothetical protein [Crocinitomicaceae bacterium]